MNLTKNIARPFTNTQFWRQNDDIKCIALLSNFSYVSTALLYSVQMPRAQSFLEDSIPTWLTTELLVVFPTHSEVLVFNLPCPVRRDSTSDRLPSCPPEAHPMVIPIYELDYGMKKSSV